jgi:hypothetical protein
VQSAIVRRVLQRQLEGPLDCDVQFRAVWTDNADALSRQYAEAAR